jgi:hypothetical protein
VNQVTMSIIVTLYENIADYVSERFTNDTPYQSQQVIPLATRSQEESMLTRIYEQMEKGLLIPYDLFPKKNKVTTPITTPITTPRLQYPPSYMSTNSNVVDLGV